MSPFGIPDLVIARILDRSASIVSIDLAVTITDQESYRLKSNGEYSKERKNE